MKPLFLTMITAVLILACVAPMALAATAYSQGWDVPGDLAGWGPNTLNTTAVVVNSGGNPNGYIESSRDPIGVFPVGIYSLQPDVTGDYAAANIRRITFDVRFEQGTVDSALFRVRYLDDTHNGWHIHFTKDFTAGTWKTYKIDFDPTWTDADAIAHGWVQETIAPSFAETMAHVLSAEVRISGPGLPLVVGIDNFNLVSCVGGPCPCLDTDAPKVTVTLDRTSLWPANHKLAQVCATVSVTDDCDAHPTVSLQSVTSNEPDNGTGDGDTPNDIQSVTDGDNCFQLRAERSANGDGRTYTITYCATDAAGHTGCGSATVTVPKDQQGHAHATSGISQLTNRLDSGAGTFTFWILTNPDVALSNYADVSGAPVGADFIDLSSIFVGNEEGFLAPISVEQKDVDRDGLSDVKVTVDANAMRAIFSAASSDETKALQASPIALRYQTLSDGAGYELPDVFGLDPEAIAGVSPNGKVGFALRQSTPNPFSRQTTISYALARAGAATLRVFDVNGREMRTLFNGENTAGEHSARWDGRDRNGRLAASGTYYLRLTQGTQSQTRKLVFSH